MACSLPTPPPQAAEGTLWRCRVFTSERHGERQDQDRDPHRRSGRHRAGDRLKAALDPAVQAACDPILVCDPDVLERHARACGIGEFRRRRKSCALPAAGNGVARLRRGQPDRRPRLDRVLRRRREGRYGWRGRRRRGRAAERNLDRAGRHHVRRPSVVRRAADRHRRERRLHDAVLRRHADRALHAAPERARGDRADHARECGAHRSAPRTRRCSRMGIASAEDRGQRPQSARRRRRAVRPRRDRDHQAGDGRCGGAKGIERHRARSAPTPCFTCRASTRSS